MDRYTVNKHIEKRRQIRRQQLTGLALISPYILIFVLFTIVPFVMGVTMSFMQYNPSNTAQNAFVGLKNYVNLFNFKGNIISR